MNKNKKNNEAINSINSVNGIMKISGNGANWGWFEYDGWRVGLMTEDKRMPKIKDVRFFDNKVTVVWFDDKEPPIRVVCKDGDVFSPEHGLAIAIAKKYYGSYERFQHSLKKAKYFEGKKKVKRG